MFDYFTVQVPIAAFCSCPAGKMYTLASIFSTILINEQKRINSMHKQHFDNCSSGYDEPEAGLVQKISLEH